MDNVHLDYWTYNASTLKFFLVSSGPKETPFIIDVQQQSWQSLIIPLSAFSNVDLTDIFQIKIKGNGTVYLDNTYFSSDAVTVTDAHIDGVQIIMINVRIHRKGFRLIAKAVPKSSMLHQLSVSLLLKVEQMSLMLAQQEAQ
jgi:hypothetical protein